MNESKPQTFSEWYYQFNCDINYIDEDDFLACWEAAQASARQEDAIEMFKLERN